MRRRKKVRTQMPHNIVWSSVAQSQRCGNCRSVTRWLSFAMETSKAMTCAFAG